MRSILRHHGRWLDVWTSGIEYHAETKKDYDIIEDDLLVLGYDPILPPQPTPSPPLILKIPRLEKSPLLK